MRAPVGLGSTRSYPGETSGVMSLTDSYSLDNLGHHGKNSSRQLLITEIRHPKLLILVPFSSPEAGSKKVTVLPSPGFFGGVLL